jgi:flagellar basal-body rod protein FlgB
MFAQLTAGLDFQATALSLRSERQRVIASNIANSDTPGYAARDINFKEAMAAATGHGGTSLPLAVSTAAAPGHIPIPGNSNGAGGTAAELGYTVQTQPAMDNNSVDLDRERANFVDNAVRYESTLRFINGYSKTILSAIQGQ